MKRSFLISVAAGLFIVLVCVAASVFAVDRYKRLADKIEKAKRGIAIRISQGRDITRPYDLLKQAKVALDAKRVDEGEALLDESLKLIEAISTKQDITEVFPEDWQKEETCNLYVNPQQVEIEGYDDNCMEPFISRDGKYLFFNNSNDEIADTHLHVAQRVVALKFKYLGPLKGAASSGKDMAPSGDSAGNLFFTSTRSFAENGLTIYGGRWSPGELSLTGVAAVLGDMSSPPSWLKMDCELSPKGNLLVLAQAEFTKGATVPTKSDLELRRKEGTAFRKFVPGDYFLRNVNTPALEYAPAISADESELFFTRSSLRRQNGKLQPYFRIMVATRTKSTEPFGTPRVLAGLTGLIEGPTLSLDKSELFFHRKLGDKFVIFRAERSKGQL